MADRHLLIGSGPASIAAAETIRAADPAAHVTVAGAERYGYYSRPGLAYYLAKEIREDGLYPFSREELAHLGVEMVNDRALGIDRGAHRVRFESGRELPYDRLLIATGSWAIPMGVPGADLDGVTKLDDMHDARDLLARCRTTKAAVVVGGGITALEIVEGLCAHDLEVHYFMRKDRYWGNVLSETESQVIEDGLRRRGVEIHHFTELARVLGENGRVTGVETGKGERIACGLVAVAIGVLPQKQLAEEAGLQCDRGVLVDEFLRASDPDVYAAGDIAEVRDAASGRGTVEVLWNSAVMKGRVAGHNMARGASRAYAAGSPLNVTRIAGFKITIMGTVGTGADSDVKGIVRGDSETWRQAGEATVIETEAGDAHVRLAVRDDRIVGAVVMGDQALSFPLQELVAAGADVSPMVTGLTAAGAPVGVLVEDFYRDWKARRVQAP
jgi:NAD(P)H-nitrite reductase large subunit